MKVSFIIPVYRVEEYLSECVESILMQTYKDFELLLIDDGSPDKCPKLCDEWAAKDYRIRTLHKSNGGLSDARNYGLSYAEGEYIIFVDSDDFWIGRDSLEKLMNIVEAYPECDFISFNCLYYYQRKKVFSKWLAYNEILAHPTDKNTALCSLVESGTLPMSACLKVISRESLSNMDLHFVKGMIAEDIPWFIDLLNNSKKCMFVNQYIYAYRQNVMGSITNTRSTKSIEDLFAIVKSEIAKIENRSFSHDAKDALYSFLAYEFCILLTTTSKMSKSFRGELLRYKWLLNYTTNPKVRKAAIVNSFLGIKVTEWVLKIYMKYIKR